MLAWQWKIKTITLFSEARYTCGSLLGLSKNEPRHIRVRGKLAPPQINYEFQHLTINPHESPRSITFSRDEIKYL